jgi:hypothetical protein
MKTSFFVMLVFCLVGLTEAKEFDYRNVLEAGTGRVGDVLVRYLTWSEDYCIVIQNLVFGGDGKVSAEKKICSLEGKRFSDGYADVDLKRGVFEDGKLFLELGVTPLQPIGETIMTCEVVFHDGVADHLACKEKLTEENCTCSSGKLDSRTSEVATEGAR